METRRQFHDDLEKMFESIRKMSVLAAESLSKALSALDRHDTVLADRVIAEDKKIDELQQEIESFCIRLLATEQPVAKDLRTIITAIKIVSHLERIGDHGRHLAKAVHTVPEEVLRPVFGRMQDLAERGTKMMHESITAFIYHDEAGARNAACLDDDIDRGHRELVEVIMGIMKSDPNKIEPGVRLLFLARFLERLGDHVTNICEWVVYSEKASHVELNL
jgi:phosphate transport system protein